MHEFRLTIYHEFVENQIPDQLHHLKINDEVVYISSLFGPCRQKSHKTWKSIVSNHVDSADKLDNFKNDTRQVHIYVGYIHDQGEI
jgi:hypothetical protein